MPYELRAKGRTVQTFDTEDEAVAGARELIRTQPDSDPEIWDTTNRQACCARREQGMARGSRPQGRLLTPRLRMAWLERRIAPGQ
jgi:hypothetical protein